MQIRADRPRCFRQPWWNPQQLLKTAAPPAQGRKHPRQLWWFPPWTRSPRALSDERRDAKERAAIIAKYGSKKAATAPCERERALNAATAHLARKVRKTYANGIFTVDTLDGWNSGIDDPPASVIEAVSNALPMPTTIQEASEEHEYWEARNREIDIVCGPIGERVVGLAAQARWDIVRDLLETGLRASNLDEVLIRQRYLVERESSMPEVEKAVLVDLEHLVQMQAAPAAPVQNGHDGATSTTTSARRAEVLRLLSNVDTAGLSDREIARRVGVSPQTVGNIRRRQS